MDFIVVKINGKDYSHRSHEDTVAAFNTASEPIVVEVLRRKCYSPLTSANIDNMERKKVESIATQTDPLLGCVCHSSFRVPSPPPLDSVIELEYFSDCLTMAKNGSTDYEEILLQRLSADDRIGLTLCYGEENYNGYADIFIRDIEDDSLAGRAGKLQRGDQIIAINSQRVRNRQDVRDMFSENRSDIKLLISRPALYSQALDDGFNEEEKQDFLSQSEGVSETNFMPLIEEEVSELEEDYSTLTDTATLPSHTEKEGKDSGVGHDSAQSSEHECDSTHYDSIYCMMEQTLHETKNFRSQIEARCNNKFSQEQYSYQLHGFNTNLNAEVNRCVPRMGVKAMPHPPENSLPRSESADTAYNTENSLSRSENRDIPYSSAECRNSSNQTVVELTKSTNGLSLCLFENRSSGTKETRERKKSRKHDKNVSRVSRTNDLDIVYTTEDKLAELMMSQQKILLKQSKTCSSLDATPMSHQPQQTEWVVKIRSDGTRYITRRPKKLVLSERKEKIETERCGLTTDDDAMSELKVGKYWSKEDRRHHFHKAKEYKKSRAFKQEKLDQTKKNAQNDQKNILELSYKKSQRHAVKDLSFLTVQELLAHRGRIQIASSNLFSVTTV